MEVTATQFEKQIVPALQKELGVRNRYQVPHMEKIVVNAGFGRAVAGEDKKEQRAKVFEQVTKMLSLITGQKPSVRAAKKSIAGFKIRQGDTIGMSVTLRGKRMFDFLERFVNVALPRVRDFRGLSQSVVDPRGICTVGIKEHAIFPELMTEDFGRTYGLQVTVVPTVRSREAGLALYRALGFPFKKQADEPNAKKSRRKKK